jgi:hypothetical protein
MSVRMTAAWRPLTIDVVAPIAGHMGVYQLAVDDGDVVYIGMAGGLSRFGLRGELLAAIDAGDMNAAQFGLAAQFRLATQFRLEVTTAYFSRYRELLAAYLADHGKLPVGNASTDVSRVGRIAAGR